jgi:phage terminase large subunit-like protein
MTAVLDAPAAAPPSRSLIDVLIGEGGYEAVMAKLKASDHPLIPLPTLDQCITGIQAHGEAWLPALVLKREQVIQAEKSDPIYYGHEPQQWRDADALMERCKDILISGSNRGSKSEYAAKRVVRLAMKKAGASIWCLSTSTESSNRDQQKLIYKYLPRYLKDSERGPKKRSGVKYITYSVANGFNNNVLVLPNGSEIRFMNYEQNRQVIEGGQVDLWWADEEIPLDWIQTLRGRTVDRKGKGIVTFTPITGFTPSIGEYFNGATVTAWRDCEHVPQFKWPGGKAGQVPYMMDCLRDDYAVIFFSARDNPYIDWEELVKIWKDKPTQDVLIRLYGVTQKSSGSVFPRFGKHNIVGHDKIQDEFKKNPPTRYHVIDFAWNRNWCMLWAGVQRIKDKKRIYIYREWPDFDTYGEWVIASDKADGARGPAQSTLGYGIVDYKRLIRDVETTNSSRETIYLRFGDPRSGAATSIAEEGATTIFNDLEGTAGGLEPLIVEPAAGREGDYHIREGVNLINNWLEYNPDRPISLANEPQLYVSTNCQNLTRCMQMWTGADGDRGASKDFCDALRYLAMMSIDYYEPQQPNFWGGGSY